MPPRPKAKKASAKRAKTITTTSDSTSSSTSSTALTSRQKAAATRAAKKAAKEAKTVVKAAILAAPSGTCVHSFCLNKLTDLIIAVTNAVVPTVHALESESEPEGMYRLESCAAHCLTTSRRSTVERQEARHCETRYVIHEVVRSVA